MYDIFTFKYTNSALEIKDFSIIDYQYDTRNTIRLNKINNNIVMSNRFNNSAFSMSTLDIKIKKLCYTFEEENILFNHMYKLYIMSKIYDQ